MRQHRLPPGDFPDLERFRSVLLEMDFTTFAKARVPPCMCSVHVLARVRVTDG